MDTETWLTKVKSGIKSSSYQGSHGFMCHGDALPDQGKPVLFKIQIVLGGGSSNVHEEVRNASR